MTTFFAPAFRCASACARKPTQGLHRSSQCNAKGSSGCARKSVQAYIHLAYEGRTFSLEVKTPVDSTT